MELGLAVWRHQSRETALPILEDALRWTEAHSDVDPFQHARLLYYLGRYEEVLPIFEELAAEQGRSQDLGYQALTLDGLGRTAEADSVIDLFDEFPRARYPALLAARRGDVEGAVHLLRANFEAGMPYYAWNQVNLHRDPDLEPIRDHPLFQALMRPSG